MHSLICPRMKKPCTTTQSFTNHKIKLRTFQKSKIEIDNTHSAPFKKIAIAEENERQHDAVFLYFKIKTILKYSNSIRFILFYRYFLLVVLSSLFFYIYKQTSQRSSSIHLFFIFHIFSSSSCRALTSYFNNVWPFG